MDASSQSPNAIVKPPVVVGAEDHADEVLVVGDLYNDRVAEDMNKFILESMRPRAYVGISTVLVFALAHRVCVRGDHACAAPPC